MSTLNRAEAQSKSAELLSLVRELVAGMQSARLPLILKKAEAARELGVGTTELDWLIKSNQIAVVYYKDNGHPKIPLSEVERFIAQKLDEASRQPHGSKETAAKPARTVRAGSADAADQEVEKLRALRKKRRAR